MNHRLAIGLILKYKIHQKYLIDIQIIQKKLDFYLELFLDRSKKVDLNLTSRIAIRNVNHYQN